MVYVISWRRSSRVQSLAQEYQKTVSFIFTAVRTSNLTRIMTSIFYFLYYYPSISMHNSHITEFIRYKLKCRLAAMFVLTKIKKKFLQNLQVQS
jgi:hypothetical protein